MQLTQFLTAIAALTPYVLASANAPSIDELRDTHRVHQVPGGKRLPGPVLYANALAKYGKPVPANLRAAASAALAASPAASSSSASSKSSSSSKKSSTSTSIKPSSSSSTKISSSTKVTTTVSTTREVASVTATNRLNDVQYLINVTLGSSQVLLNLDTGSSDLWAFSDLLPTAMRGSHRLYKTASGTKNSAQTWGISYAEGSSASGIEYVDKVIVGGVTATVQAVEAATSVSTQFVSGSSSAQDGNLGMGFIDGNTCSPNYCYGFMHQAASVMDKVLFTATLRHQKPGEYDFGFIDPSKYTGYINYVDVVDFQGAGYWEFFTTGYSVGSGAQQSDALDAIADTGTTLLLLDDTTVNGYWGAVTGAENSDANGGIIFPCTSTLPDFSLWINNVQHTMPGIYANMGTVASPAGYCFGGIQSQGSDAVSVIGDVFLKSQFVVFDVCLQRIGWAQQAGVAI